MSLTPSNMMPLATIAPNFELLDTISGQQKSLQQLKGRDATLIMFICNHCPYVIHIDDALVKLAKDYENCAVSFIAISANSVKSHPQDGPEKMAEKASKLAYPFVYLYDQTQQTAKAYQAACTPDFFLFDHQLKCVYRGQFDDSRPGNNIAVTGKDIRNAIDSLLSNQPISPQQKPSVGCNIKWDK